MQSAKTMRRPGMAIACMGAITLSVFGMYFAGKDSRAKEGPTSPYREGGNMGQSDTRMNSSDVSAVVSLPKPGQRKELSEKVGPAS